MTRIRVTLVSTSYPLAEHESSGVFVSRLVEYFPDNSFAFVVTPAVRGGRSRLQKDKFEVLPFNYAPDRWQVLAHKPGGIPVALKNNKWLYFLVPSLLIFMFIACYRAAKKSDLIHANWAICGCISGVVGKLLKCPVVTTLRGDDVTRAKTSSLDRLILTNCIRLSTCVVTVSQDMEAWILDNYPWCKGKVRVVTNGVEDAFLEIGEKRIAKRVDAVCTLITVCSLIPRKGVDVIIKALAKIRDIPGISLKIVGSGPEEDKLRDLVKIYSLDNNVQFLGTRVPSEIPGLLASSDVFILASASEGRPNAVLEAMAASMPVIAPRIEGVTEIIKNNENGILFEPQNSDHLASCISRLCADNIFCAKLGCAAYGFVLRNRLLWSETAKRYFDVYKEAMKATNENR